MRVMLPVVLLLAGCASQNTQAEEAASAAAIAALLDDFHDAAARADGERYFGHFAPEGVFIGTDATERWTVSEFRAYAQPHFSQGRGWTYTALERHIQFAPAGNVGWFDERLTNEKYGETRGSGAVRLVGDRWKIAHYVLSFAIPNDAATDVVERVRAGSHR